MWREAVEQVANMMAMDPYPGFEGEFFSMPVRNVVPKPVQKPHPPMWVACSNRDTIHLAAQLGLGALTFAFVDPAEARHWVTDYYETFKRECVPIGHSVNPNIAMVSSFSCHPNEQEAKRAAPTASASSSSRSATSTRFGKHKPGRTNVWERFESVRDEIGLEVLGEGTGGIGTPKQLRDHLRKFADAGVDQSVFIQQGGNNLHENICEDLDLFAKRGDAGVQGRGRGAAAAQGRRTGAVHRSGDGAQAAHARAGRRRDPGVPGVRFPDRGGDRSVRSCRRASAAARR